MYKNEYALPKEEEMIRLPLTTLKMIANKNKTRSTGTKRTIVNTLIQAWSEHVTNEWNTDVNILDSLEQVQIMKRGKVHSSLSFFSLGEMYLPVFDHDYQEE